MTSERAAIIQPVVADLQRVFGERLEAVVVYGWQPSAAVPSLALVKSLALDDLNVCAARTAAWRRAGAATPLLLTSRDFGRSLDAFPIEYGEIIAHHEVVFGTDPFEGLSIDAGDLRRACEVQVKSHLLHLREDYLESGGHFADVDALVRESAPAFVALLRNLARLDGAPLGDSADLVRYAERRMNLDSRTAGDLAALANPSASTGVDAVKLFPSYLRAIQQLADFVDSWRQA